MIQKAEIKDGKVIVTLGMTRKRNETTGACDGEAFDGKLEIDLRKLQGYVHGAIRNKNHKKVEGSGTFIVSVKSLEEHKV